MRGISWQAVNRLASQEGLCSMEYVSYIWCSDCRHNLFFRFKEEIYAWCKGSEVPLEDHVLMIPQPCQYGGARGCIRAQSDFTCRRSLAGVFSLSLSRLGPGPAQLAAYLMDTGSFCGRADTAAHFHVLPRVKKDRIDTSTSVYDIFLRLYFI